MKKHILFFTLALFLIMPSTLFAFDSNAKGYIEGNIGLSIGDTTSNVKPLKEGQDQINAIIRRKYPSLPQALGYYITDEKSKMKTNPLNLNTEIGYYINKNFSFGVSFDYNSFEIKDTSGSIIEQDYSSLSLLGSPTETVITKEQSSVTVKIKKFRSLINMAYHYNISDKFNLFASPAVGFDVNFINYTDDNEDDYGDIASQFSLGAKLSLGAIYNIKDNIYCKSNVSYNYSSAVFDGTVKESGINTFEYEGKSHMWTQFNVGVGTRF